MIETKTINGYRNYIIEDQPFISVTSFLDMTSDKSGLIKWRKRVGDEEANRISSHAASNGTKVHALIEQYHDDQNIVSEEMNGNAYFNNIFPYLKKINKVISQETVLYSKKLKIAGRVDGIVEYDNALTVLDYKTSGKPKIKKWIDNYFLQCTLYSICWQEMTGQKIDQIVILITGPEQCQEFIDQRKMWFKPLEERYKMYLRLLKSQGSNYG